MSIELLQTIAFVSGQDHFRVPAGHSDSLEAGVADYVATSWQGLAVPAGVSPSVVTRLRSDRITGRAVGRRTERGTLFARPDYCSFMECRSGCLAPMESTTYQSLDAAR